MADLDSFGLVIFGASGDLTFRKLVPSLLHLYSNGKLGNGFFLLGTGRTQYSSAEYRDYLRNKLSSIDAIPEPSVFDQFIEHVHYIDLDPGNLESYQNLSQTLAALFADGQAPNNTLYYLATPPSLFSVVSNNLGQSGLNDESDGWKRMVVEKPIGYDLASAEDLDEAFHQSFSEDQIFRIDHYLGKETVQNLIVFRFSNGMFEPLWNRNFIDYIEITGSESLGVEGRGGYYDGAGALRDMLQNHLLQVLAMVAMEPPMQINADSTRDEVAKALNSIHPIAEKELKENLVLGQYTESSVRGKRLPGYRDEPGVDSDSRTETYVALKLFINNWRWQGVPFYLRTGKRLPTRVTEVVIHFQSTPHPMFSESSSNNKLIIRIQPDEGIVITFGLKKPGSGFEPQEVSMDFRYEDLANVRLLSAYERLLLDALSGDATLFARSDAVLASWKLVQPILDLKSNDPPLYGYACGTWGPQEADAMLEQDGRSWRFPCKNLTNTDYCEL